MFLLRFGYQGCFFTAPFQGRLSDNVKVWGPLKTVVVGIHAAVGSFKKVETDVAGASSKKPCAGRRSQSLLATSKCGAGIQLVYISGLWIGASYTGSAALALEGDVKGSFKGHILPQDKSLPHKINLIDRLWKPLSPVDS